MHRDECFLSLALKTEFLSLSSILKTHLDEVYPNVVIALRIMLNCPNTVASAERNFSKLKLIKTFNRSHMTNSRLSSLARLVHGNGIPMAIPWVTYHGMGQHTFVFPMRLRYRMRVSECYWIVILRLYFWILKSINFIVLHVSLYM